MKLFILALLAFITVGGICEAKECIKEKNSARRGSDLFTGRRNTVERKNGERLGRFSSIRNARHSKSNRRKTHSKLRQAKASWYSSQDACGPRTNALPGCPTASGRSLHNLEKRGIMFAAIPKGAYKMGAKLRVTNRITKNSVIVTALDTGGFKKYGRGIDLSKAAFKRLAPLEQGIIKVRIEEIK